MLKLLSFAFIAFSLSTTVQAEELNSPYFQIKSVSIQEEEVSEQTLMKIRSVYRQQQLDQETREDNPLEDILNPIKETEKIVDAIINIGAKVWKVFEASTPVVNLSTKRANALPREYKDWREMSDWSDVQARQYTVSYKNGFDAEVVRFSVLMTYAYNGSFNGRGKYLNDVGFLVNEYRVAPLYTLEGESEVVRVQNVGRAEEPIAAMELNMVWRVNNVLFKSQNALNYFVRGDGPVKVREVSNF